MKIDDIHKIDKIIKEVIVKQKKDDLERLREQYVFIKDDGLEKSAKRVVSIANACRSRNYNNNVL